MNRKSALFFYYVIASAITQNEDLLHKLLLNALTVNLNNLIPTLVFAQLDLESLMISESNFKFTLN